MDDESQVRESLRRVFVSENFDVTAAGNVAEAMESFETEPCDVAVIDLNLNGECGHQLARQIRDFRPQVSVVMITACPDRAPAGVLADCVAMLAKPLDLCVLLETVRAASASSRRYAALRPETVGSC